MKMKGSNILVTGGASGLGEGTVQTIVESGGKAVILDIAEDQGTALVQKLGRERALFVKTDVTSEKEVQAAIDQATEQFGSITGLVNCAGVGAFPKNEFKKVLNKGFQPHALWTFKLFIEVNLVGTFNALRLAAAQMALNEPNEHGERGVIVNTASIAAFEGQSGQAAYSASKGGIVGMTLPIARDLARNGIRVVTIAPGLMDTPAFGKLTDEVRRSLSANVPFPPRLGYPSEFAMLVQSIFENPLLNGETIRLDGAFRLQPK